MIDQTTLEALAIGFVYLMSFILGMWMTLLIVVLHDRFIQK